jgi:cytochrome c oxidase subunit II
MLMGSAVVLTAVVGLWWYALRRRPRSYDDAAAARVARRWILWGGIALPAFGIALLLAFGIPLGHRLLPPTDDREAALHVEVTGHQWWWEVRYSDHDVVTANQLVLPAATPVHVAVTSADVIHAFWVPSLGGKIDMIPGHTNRTRLFADEPGLHRGQCAEFCGAQHARMILTVEVLTPQDFEAWLAARREPAVLTPVRDTDSGVGQSARLARADHGQPHHPRPALHGHRPGVLPDRRAARDADARPAGAARAGPSITRLQPGLHHARHGDDVPVRHADARGAGDLPDPEDDRRPRPGMFPRLTAFGYWCYLFGGLILCLSLVLGLAPDSGWFMYTPLEQRRVSPGPNSDFWLLGITFVEISAVAAGVELTVSILRTRTAGMSLHRMPLFAWYILVTALMIVVGFPPLILGSVLLELERAAGCRSSMSPAAATRCSGSTCSGCSAIPRSTSSSCRRRASSAPDPGVRAPPHRRLPLGRAVDHHHRLHQLRPVGAPHVHGRHSAPGAGLLLGRQHAGGDTHGIQIFAWLATLWTRRPRLSACRCCGWWASW